MLDLNVDLSRLRRATEDAPAAADEGRQRFPDYDDFQPPEDVDHPHSSGVETARSALSIISDNYLASVTLAGAVLVFSALAWVHLSRYFLTAVTNPWVQRGVAALLLFGAGARFGWRNRGERERQRETLVLFDPSSLSLKRFPCRTVHEDEHDRVVELFRGYRFGLAAMPYNVADLSAALDGSVDGEDGETARLLLDTDRAARAVTDFGVVHVQACIEIRPMNGDRANVRARPPRQAHPGTVDRLMETLDDLRDVLSAKETEIGTLREQLDNMKELAQANVEDITDLQDRVIEQNARLLRASGGEPLGEPAVGPLTDGEREAIDGQVAPDA